MRVLSYPSYAEQLSFQTVYFLKENTLNTLSFSQRTGAHKKN